MGFILWLIAVILVIVGIVQLIQGQIILGLALIILGFLAKEQSPKLFTKDAVA